MTVAANQNPPRFPAISAIGLASWDQLLLVDRYPRSGSYAIIHDQRAFPGGTTANAAVTLATLGATTTFHTALGTDESGRQLRRALEATGVRLQTPVHPPGAPTDESMVIVEEGSSDRTILWRKGARPVLGDRLDVEALFTSDLLIVDVDDPRLRRFLVDLPVHTYPSSRLLGTLTYLVADDHPDQRWDELLRFDLLVGNEREVMAITGSDSLEKGVKALQSRMRGSNLRGAAITRGRHGAIGMTPSDRWESPAFAVDVIDTTGAGDAFAGGFAFAMALRWNWPDALRFANAVAALSTRALGAQSALPRFSEVSALIEAQSETAPRG